MKKSPLILLAGICLLFSACILPRPVEDRTRFYLLEAPADDHHSGTPTTYHDPGEEGLVLGLRRIRVADYVQTPGMVVRTGEGQLRYASYHRWAESLDRGAARLLREELRRKPAITSVYFFPEAGRETVDFEVEVQLLACDAVERDDGTGGYLFRASWSVYDPDEGRLIATGDFAKRGNWQPGDYAAFARAISRAGSELGNEIAEALETLAAGEG